MEQIGKIIKAKMEDLMQSSCNTLLQELPAQKQIRQTGNSFELSIYADIPTPETVIAVQIARLKIAFPRMEKYFFDVLAERIVDNNFTEQRLIDAVNHVIDNFKYKELNVADIIGFDRRVKLYTGNEFMNAQTSGILPSEFESREIDGVTYWVRKVDLLNARN